MKRALIAALFAGAILPQVVNPTRAGEPLRPWQDYRTIMWVGDSAYKDRETAALFFERLREMGINTAMVHGDSNLQPLLDNQFPYYVENIVNRGLCLKWNSGVSDWDKFVTAWAKGGRPESALVRDFCLDDPEWRSWARQQIQQLVRKNQQHTPLAYDIRDELSTTISANPFDYDFNPIALKQFRGWLQTQYRNLPALNTQWETKFTSWAEVRPFTTDQIKNRMASGDALPRGQPDWQALQQLKFDPLRARRESTRWNFSPWADFRTYMDVSLATVLDELRRTAHEIDPRTPVGIEGTQMPHAFGGYDLWRLSRALDWVEPYDIGNAREILGSFMPGKPVLTTVFEADTNHARRRLWHLLLEGDRGCIVWWSEDCFDWKSASCKPTPKARALAPVLKEMTSPLARLFLRAEREYDPILIHYSQPSIQVDWLLESTVDGSTWLRRFSSFEAEHNQMARTRNAWLKAFQDLGYAPRFVSSADLEAGALANARQAVLVLPTSWALSEKEASAIQTFLQPTTPDNLLRAVFSNGTPGLFDEHGKFRSESPLARLLPTTNSSQVSVAQGQRLPVFGAGNIADYAVQRLRKESAWTDWIAAQMKSLPPVISLPSSACARVHRFKVKRGHLLAFERNIDYPMSEDLKQAGGNELLERSIEIEVTFPEPVYLYDLRAIKYLGQSDHLRFNLDPWQPSLFALSSEKVPAASIVETLLPE